MPRKQSVGPRLVAFGRVIEHDVENDFDPGAMQRLDHVAKFVDRAERILPRAVGLVRREERDRRVAPVVDLSRRTVVGVELKHRQQFDGRDAELLQIGNLLDQAGVGAARLLGDAGTRMPSEAADVHLVDDRARPTSGAAAHPLPSRRRWIDDHALHRRRRVIAGERPGFAGRSSSERRRRGRRDRAAPSSRSNRSPCVRVRWALDAIAVDLSRPDTSGTNACQ